MTTYNVICDGVLRGKYQTLHEAQLAAYLGGKNFRGVAPRIFWGRQEYPVPREMLVDVSTDNGARFMVTR